MKKSQLRQIIREELNHLTESRNSDEWKKMIKALENAVDAAENYGKSVEKKSQTPLKNITFGRTYGEYGDAIVKYLEKIYNAAL